MPTAANSMTMGVIAALVLGLACSQRESAPRCASNVAALPERIHRGVCLAHNYQSDGNKGYGTATSAATLRELAELGVDWVSLTPFGFMRALDDPVVHWIEGYPAGETDPRLRREIEQAKSLYAPVAMATDTTPDRVRLTMQKRLDALEAVSRAVDRPVTFTEVGYRTTEDALVEPHAWPERASDPRIDLDRQAFGYAVFTEAIRDRDWVRGVYWWKWFTDPLTTEEGPAGFSPRGKPAEAVLRASFAGNCAAQNLVP